MLSAAIVTSLNTQIKHELYSSHLYLAMAAYCETLNLRGVAHWMELQAEEEREHALKLYEYLNSNGARVALSAIDQPPADYGDPVTLFKKVLEHEKFITAQIHKLYEQAGAEKDYRTQVMLHWFISEQQEEEETAAEILARVEAVEGKMSSMLWIDKELKKRAGK
jgi:ferritin